MENGRMRMKPDERTVKLFENDRFATENGAVIEEVEEHYAKCSLKLGSRHLAEAVCIKNGRSTSYYKIEVKDELGNLTAVVNTTGYRVK